MGDSMSFQLNLTHNQSVPVDLKNNLKVVLWSQYLEPVNSSLFVVAGNISNGSEEYNSSAISFDVTLLDSGDLVSVTFKATVKDSIQPLSNLYFAALVTGQSGGNGNFHYGPVPSQPTLYAVFPTVSLTRTSYSCKYHSCVLACSRRDAAVGQFNFSLEAKTSLNFENNNSTD